MRFATLAVLVASVCFACGAQETPKPKVGGPPANLAAGPVTAWDFGPSAAGQAPEGFTVASGSWQVAADASAPSKGQVLSMTARDAKASFNVVLVAKTNYRDVDLRVRMKSVAGKEDQGGGLVWRARDADNYYVVRFNPLEDNLRVYKVVEGKRILLECAEVLDAGTWCALRVVMLGDHLWCYLNGQLLLDVQDATFKDGGQIGLWTKADAVTSFDDLSANEVTVPKP